MFRVASLYFLHWRFLMLMFQFGFSRFVRTRKIVESQKNFQLTLHQQFKYDFYTIHLLSFFAIMSIMSRESGRNFLISSGFDLDHDIFQYFAE